MASRRPAKSAGFTIIEVMIVITIMGVIMLLIFMAIPALLRNSRNNQRKQDVATVLQAVSHYELADSGNFPQACGNGAQPSCPASCPANSNDPFLCYTANKLSYYNQTGKITATPQTTGATIAHVSGSTPLDTVQVYNFEKCSTATLGGADSTGAGSSDVVALYALESGGATPTYECEQL